MWRIAFSLLLIVVLGAAALFFATHLPIPEDRSQRVFAPDLVRRGGELAALGYCASCHTAENGKPFAGGRPLATPFGSFSARTSRPTRRPALGFIRRLPLRGRCATESIVRDVISTPSFPIIISPG